MFFARHENKVLRLSVAGAGLGLVCAAIALASSPAAPFDHSRWDRILKATVTDTGWVDYRAVRTKWKDDLDAYIRALGAANVKDLGGADEEKAFWINAYNALCVRTLVEHDLPKEVPHAAIFGKNIFKEERYRVAGKVRSLDEIEHEILREKFDDPRIHAAVVCGASSCPRLRPEAYTGKDLSKALDEENESWIQRELTKSGKRKNYLDRESKTFWASKIFDWYEEDFGGSTAGILRHIAKYASAEDREFLEKNRVRLRFLAYDWSLNIQDEPAAAKPNEKDGA